MLWILDSTLRTLWFMLLILESNPVRLRCGDSSTAATLFLRSLMSRSFCVASAFNLCSSDARMESFGSFSP